MNLNEIAFSLAGSQANEVASAAIKAARGSSYKELAKFLPKTDISVRSVDYPFGFNFLSITDISVGSKEVTK